MTKHAQRAPAATPFEGKTFFYSGPPLDIGASSLGKRHYSYRFALNKFVDSLEFAGANCVELRLPEFYANENAFPDHIKILVKNDGLVPHLIFRSTEEIRLLKCAFNISCFAWEFDVLDDFTSMDGNLLNNQVHMLSICDEIWVPCAFTKKVLNNYGVKQVEVLPAPIDVPTRAPSDARARRGDWLGELALIPALPMNQNPHWSFEDSVIANRAAYNSLFTWLQNCPQDLNVFISVLNPEDHRKNMNAMLRGFHNFNNIKNNSILIIKLVTSLSDRKIDPRDLVYKLISNKLDDNGILQSSRILFITDYLSDDSMDSLYRAADFYLCTSIAEGQNLPLLEAMARGAIPVSPRHTAMADYLDDTNSINMTSRRVDNFIPHVAPATFCRHFQIDHSNERDVFEALLAANAVPASKREQLSDASVETVRRLYSPEVVTKKIENRLDKIARTPRHGDRA